jgi:hypothetical protein
MLYQLSYTPRGDLELVAALLPRKRRAEQHEFLEADATPLPLRD